jgi:hypothetical protein
VCHGMTWKCQKQVLKTDRFFYQFPTNDINYEVGKILNRKIIGAFYGLIKQDSKNLVGSTTPTRKTLKSLSQYNTYSSDRENKYSPGLNIP